MKHPFAVTLDSGSSLANLTGSWRTMRPVYVDRLPPCNHACPAGENIQAWLYHGESGDYESAWRVLTKDNPMPAVMGRVCYHPCEGACNRAQVDETVGINSVERFLGDEAIKRNWRFTPPEAESGKRVLVVGSGPSGLSAAYHLRRLGHAVTIREAADEAGGMMRYGIPEYRLPRDVLDAEIARIFAMGVTLETGRAVTDLPAVLADGSAGRLDRAVPAVGPQTAPPAYIPAGDSARIIDALSLLHDTESGHPPLLGRRVVVYGGGDAAMGAARTARRLGAADPVVGYRRARDRTP